MSLDNVVVGDVLIFARRSSIDVSLGRDDEGRKAAKDYAASPMLRMLRLKTIPSMTPRENLDEKALSAWVHVAKKNALRMSAAAFHLGQALVKKIDVPLGIVDLDMGLIVG